MIELTNVSKIYEGSLKAVDDISFTVEEGEIFGLIGTSGCGKTTTLKMINRLEELTSGQIFIDGYSVFDRPPEQLRRRIGYVIQNVGLFPHYSVKENIAVTPKLLDWDPRRINERCDDLLQLVGMPPVEFADRDPQALSGGQQQRVGLARALAADPPIILMDEPFGALDPITKERVQKEFKKLLQGIDKTIVLVTHDVFEAFDLCDRVGLMNNGKLQQVGTPRELLFQPADEYARSFFDNHRFQLEMMSITVGDILEVIKESSALRSFSAGEGNGFSIYHSDSFFSVFEDSDPGERLIVLNEEEEQVAVITPNELLEGFQQVRRMLKEGTDD
ncbi:MAG: ATP-binding cassette domain-containing protein [Balneolaceae bacterium]|nr:ATP-binding cassette domain-containing protein [Balneolaceae bacterium]